MKTTIVQLETHDDITSACDRLGWVQSGNILVVWPEGKGVLNRRLDMVLLQRHSAKLGAQVAFLSKDPEVCYHAPRLGIPVFHNLKQAQSKQWRVPHRYRHLRKNYPALMEWKAQQLKKRGDKLKDSKFQRRIAPLSTEQTPSPTSKPRGSLHPILRFFFFTLGVSAFLSIAAVLLPSATIFIAPQMLYQETHIRVEANPQISSIRISGEVPAKQVTIIVEGRETKLVTGSMLVPNQPSTGTVVFTNLTDQPVTVSLGTVVRNLDTPAIRFATEQEGIVPAGIGQTLSLPVRCLIPGSIGNQPAHRLVVIEGLLGTQLRVDNPNPTMNGNERVEPSPNQSDRQSLSASLHKSLYQSALNELKSSLASDDLVLPSSLKLLKVIREDYQPATEEPADTLILTLQLEYQALVVSGKDLQTLAEIVLDAQLPEGTIPIANTLQIELEEISEAEQTAIASWKLSAVRKLHAQIPLPQVIQLSLGQKPSLVVKRLEEAFALKAPPEIVLIPPWWPRLPILPFRIAIVTQDVSQ